jgi:hypothetical protein
MGLAPSPDASSTQDMGSLWSTTVESMRESTGFKGPLRCQRPSRHGEACVTRHQDHHQPALLRTSPRILRLAQWRRRCRCCRAGGGSLLLDPSDPVPGRRGPERRRRPRPGGTGTPCLLTALAAVSAVDNTVRSPDRGSGSSRQRTLRRCPVPQPPDTPQVHRRPRHPRGCWRSGGRCSPTGSRRSRAAAPSPTSTRPSTATSTTRWSGRSAAPRRSSSRSGPAWSSSSSRRSGRTPSRPWSGLHPPGRRVLGRQPQHRAARQPAGRAAVDRVLHRPPRPPVPAPQLRRRAAQRPVRHPVPRRLLLRRPLRAPAARHRHRVEAVHLVADQGWKLLGDYRFDPATGLWRHRQGPVGPPCAWVSSATTSRDGSVSTPRTPGQRTPSPATSRRHAGTCPPEADGGSLPRAVGRLRGAALVCAPARVPARLAPG